jgi:methionyl-tRNA formyltransferase
VVDIVPASHSHAAAQPSRGAAAHATPLKLVFCGTPEFAVPTLAALQSAGHQVELVLTQPDRPRGRGMQLVASPVKQWALAHGLPIGQPEKIRSNEPLRTQLAAIQPDAIVVVAYGRIIPPWMLALPPLGNINLHGSLLPKYRGAAPIQWAIANGEAVTGVTTMLLEEGLDTGPTLEQIELPIPASATAADLFSQLAVIGAPLMLSTLAGLAAGTVHPHPQNPLEATHAPILTREDGRIHFTRTAQETYNRWRGFQPWPGAWTTLEGKKFTITRMDLAETKEVADREKQIPGSLFLHNGQLHAACRAGTAIHLLNVQMEGKRSIPAADFLRGHAQYAGAHLG